MATVGLLAGVGKLPVTFLREAKRLGERVAVIAVVDNTEPELAAEADVFYRIHVTKLDKVIRTLRAEGVTQATMLGKVTKEILFKGNWLPDLRALKVLKKIHDRKDDTIMLALVAELAKDGIEALDQTRYLQPLLPDVGVFTRRRPTEEELADIRFGFGTAKVMGALDIGQTVVVSRRAVMAIEAIEGTDACIVRGCELARKGAVVVKTAKPSQDARFDVPTIGLQTLRSLLEHDGAVIAIEAKKTLFVEQEEVLALANAEGVCICAVSEESLGL
ncbi:MAG: UDP-2,3-diacylglucosamine diphosphatase LpxI [Veillonellaceae bacterium]|nr:UDP-2,3-diacylglucosamine diphosphatase LpxI [Veillonellaceae bacterium]